MKTLSVIVMIPLLLLAAGGERALASENQFRELKYDILSDGKDIGDTISRLSSSGDDSKAEHSMAEYSTIKVSGWWGSIDISSVLVETYRGNNALLTSISNTQDDNTVYRVRIDSVQNAITSSFREIKKLNETEKEQMAEIAAAIVDAAAPEMATVLSRSRNLFASRKDAQNIVRFKTADYHTTENNLAFYLQQLPGKLNGGELNLLDTEDLVIRRVKLEDLGQEVVLVGDHPVQTLHVKISEVKKSPYKPAHIWIAQGESSLPYTVRYIEEDEDGETEVVLRSVSDLSAKQ